MKALTVDIGGTFIKYALMDEKMHIFERGKIETPQDSRESLIEAIGSIYDKLSYTGVDGIAISMPGILDSEAGYCFMGGALKYNDEFMLRDALHERCNTRIYMENDAKCAAMAEASVGALRDVQDGFVLIFGTMIGGGYVHNKKLVKGKHFSAGEVSYINTVRNGNPVEDNIWGNVCSTPGLCAMYAQKKGLDPAVVDGIMVFDAVNSGDKEAQMILREFTRMIAVQIFNIQTILDPGRFAIGGGISAQPVFIEYIKENLSEMYAACPYYVPQAQVETCRFRNDANLVGALQCFLQAFG